MDTHILMEDVVVNVLLNKHLACLPYFETVEKKSDKTDETEFLSVCNTDFIKGIFGIIVGNERPIVVSFPGDPNQVRPGSWFGKPWVDDKTPLLNSNNNYTSFATYTPDDEGKYRRQRKHFSALYAVMLDDIGIKVPENRITLEPSWRIETSSSNFQYGFILDEPITNPAQADNLLNSIIEGGLCDPGSSGACARLGRLPDAINGKHKNANGEHWQCKLKGWNPERRYSVHEIVNGLQIELKEFSQTGRDKGCKKNHQSDPYQDDIYIPRADENPVIKALKDSGRYKQPSGDRKHDITCPWVHDQVDHGTAYFEPSEFYRLGGFNCQHGHCANRGISELHDFLEISKIDAKHMPMIYVQAGEIPRIRDAAERELAKTLRHYQRACQIVTITTDPGTRETTVKPLSLQSLTCVMAGIAIWQRYDKRSAAWFVCDPSERHVRVLHDSISYPYLPVLNGIARQPYLRPDGSLMMSAGYDRQTGMLGVFNASIFNVADKPTKHEAERALSKLSDLLSEFAFKTYHDKAAALAGILTAVIRPSLPQSPMLHVKAPTIASGKSYLCELFTAFATPQEGTPHAFPTDEEECRKLLLAELITAPAVIEFDNLTGDLVPFNSLCTALTSEYISGRILGQSKTTEVGTRVLFLSSGNNVDAVRDMTRRVVTINLDPACETPAARDFVKQPVKEVRINRGHFVSLALTIVRAWICADKPRTECKTISTYADWSDYCRQSLLWLGQPDPAACIFEAMMDDPDRELLGEFLMVWHDCFDYAATSVKEAICRIKLSGSLRDIIGDIAGERDGSIDRRRLGWWIKRHSGRVVNGLRFVKDTSTTNNAAKWKVESVT